MSGPLPFLGLRVFVEVGRTGSVKGAATRLRVTSGAISQQIKQLELRLGLALCQRRNRELQLTAAGRRLLTDVGEAFARIEEAIEANQQNQAHRRGGLAVSTTHSFAASWLVPRLGRFTAIYPQIEVRLLTTQQLAPLGIGPGCADVAIRHGLGRWEGVDAVLLMQPNLIPVASPRLLADGLRLQQPDDCLNYPLLHDEAGQDWRLWLQALGAEYRDPRAARGTRFSDSTLLLKAAVAGQGLALLRDTYAAEDIAAGRLKVVINVNWPAEFAYYVVTSSGAAGRNPRIAKFKEWLVEEAATDSLKVVDKP